MSAQAIAHALLAREKTARRDLRSHLRLVARKGKGVTAEDEGDIEELGAELGDRFATTVRATSEGAARDGVHAAAVDAKAAIGGAALAFLAFTQLTNREDEAIRKFAAGREAQTRDAIASAFGKKVALHGDVETATSVLLSRADTIAASEASMGINRGYVDAANDIVRSTRANANLLVLEWVAVLDRRTCETCSSFDGHTTGVGEDFDGLMPGFVHARCRCFALLRRR